MARTKGFGSIQSAALSQGLSALFQAAQLQGRALGEGGQMLGSAIANKRETARQEKMAAAALAQRERESQRKNQLDLLKEQRLAKKDAFDQKISALNAATAARRVDATLEGIRATAKSKQEDRSLRRAEMEARLARANTDVEVARGRYESAMKGHSAGYVSDQGLAAAKTTWEKMQAALLTEARHSNPSVVRSVMGANGAPPAVQGVDRAELAKRRADLESSLAELKRARAAIEKATMGPKEKRARLNALDGHERSLNRLLAGNALVREQAEADEARKTAKALADHKARIQKQQAEEKYAKRKQEADEAGLSEDVATQYVEGKIDSMERARYMDRVAQKVKREEAGLKREVSSYIDQKLGEDAEGPHARLKADLKKQLGRGEIDSLSDVNKAIEDLDARLKRDAKAIQEDGRKSAWVIARQLAATNPAAAQAVEQVNSVAERLKAMGGDEDPRDHVSLVLDAANPPDLSNVQTKALEDAVQYDALPISTEQMFRAELKRRNEKEKWERSVDEFWSEKPRIRSRLEKALRDRKVRSPQEARKVMEELGATEDDLMAIFSKLGG